MADNRKNIKAISSVKDGLGDVKFSLGASSESEAIAYLVELFRLTRDRVTVKEHDAMFNKIKIEHKQVSLF